MNESLFQRGERVLIACSGGKDSVYLLERLFRERERLGIELGVAHIDHGLRPEAGEDARFVRKLAAARRLRYFERRLYLAKQRAPRGIEALARERRYEALEEIALAEGFASVATAHHRDDQIETVLLRILQGAAPRHWLGMKASRLLREGSTIRLVRPLLDISRVEIQNRLQQWKLPHREDASNENPRFLRNRVRAWLLAALPEMRRDLEEQTIALRKSAGQLESLEARLRAVVLRGRLRRWECSMLLTPGCLRNLPDWFLNPLVEGLLRDLRGIAPAGTVRAVTRLWKSGRSGAIARDPAGIEIRKRGTSLEFQQIEPKLARLA